MQSCLWNGYQPGGTHLVELASGRGLRCYSKGMQELSGHFPTARAAMAIFFHTVTVPTLHSQSFEGKIMEKD